MKILQLGSPTGLYGAERWILALIKHLDRDKFNIHVAAFQDDPSLEVPLCTEAAKLGFKTHVFKTPGKFNPKAIFQLRNYIKSRRIHILHTHAYKQDIIGLLATIGTPCKVISTPHGWSKEPDIKLRLYEMLNRAVFPFFDAVVPLSQDLFDSLASSKWYRLLCRLATQRLNDSTNLFLIKNGVDISEIDSVTEIATEIQTIREREFFVLGYIGRLTHGKGLDVLLHAVARLESIPWQLVVIGEGEQETELKNLAQSLEIENNVHFLGFREDRISFLKGFDLFVLPSRSEGTPRCLMEAMAARVPAIASDIPGCRVLIEHGKTGMLFAVENTQELAKRIDDLASDKPLRQGLTNAARRFVEQFFSAKRMAGEYQSFYLRLVDSIPYR